MSDPLVFQRRSPPPVPPGSNCSNCFHGRMAPDPNGQLDITKRFCNEGPMMPLLVQHFKRGLNGVEPTNAQIMFVMPQHDTTYCCGRWAPRSKDQANDAETLSRLQTGKSAQ